MTYTKSKSSKNNQKSYTTKYDRRSLRNCRCDTRLNLPSYPRSPWSNMCLNPLICCFMCFWILDIICDI